MFKAGSIVGDLVLDTSGFTGGLAQAQGASAGFPSMIGANIIGPMLQALQVAQEVGRGIFEALSFGVGLAADFEVANVKLEVLLGSADKAKALLAEVNQFAAATPFELPDLMAATQKLLAAEVPEGGIIETLRMLGDLALGDAEQFKDLTSIYTRGLGGNITNEDLLQIADRGIPIYAELARQIGVTKQEIRTMASSSQIDMGMVIKAMQTMTAEGGRFHGGMEKLGQTMKGQWSTLKDTVNAGIRDTVSALLEGFGAKGGLEGLIGDLGAMLPDMVEQAREFGRAVGPDVKAAASEAWATLKAMWPDIQAGIRETTVAVRELVTEIRELKDLGSFFNAGSLSDQYFRAGKGGLGSALAGSPLSTAGNLREGLGLAGPRGGQTVNADVTIIVDPKATAQQIADGIYQSFDQGVDAYIQATTADLRNQAIARGLGRGR